MSLEAMSRNWTVSTRGTAHSPSLPKVTSPTTVGNVAERAYSASSASSIPPVARIACSRTCSWA